MVTTVKAQIDDGATEFHRQKYAKFYKTGVVHANVHWPLIEDLENACDTANIPPHFVWKTKMAEYCDKTEIDWVRMFRKKRASGCAGLIYTGKPTGVDNRMFAITGAMLRNFLDARVFMMQTVLDLLKTQTMPDPTLVLVPNFVTFGKEAPVPPWQSQLVLDWLMRRYARQKMTVLYVASQVKVQSQWGEAIADHIMAHYEGVVL